MSKPEQQQKMKEQQIKEGQEGLKKVEKAKRYSKLNKLIEGLEQNKSELKQDIKILNPEYKKQIIKDYNDDIEAVKNYDFYKVKNTQLRDQLDKQYLKMFDNMKDRPKLYGMLPENKNGEYGRLGDKRYIKFVYENYGKPEPDFLGDIFPNILNEIIGLVPVIGDIAQPINDIIIESGKEKAKDNENIPNVDFTKGYEEVLNIDDLIKDAENKQNQRNQQIIEMDRQEDQLRQEQSQLLTGNGKKINLNQSNKIGYNYYTLLKKMEKKLIKS
jgi:hypothetical protein